MSKILDEIITKTNIQNIREFLLHGVEVTSISNKSFESRKKYAYDKFMDELKNELPELTDDSDLILQLNELLNTYENVFAEIGIIAGSNLARELQNYH